MRRESHPLHRPSSTLVTDACLSARRGRLFEIVPDRSKQATLTTDAHRYTPIYRAASKTKRGTTNCNAKPGKAPQRAKSRSGPCQIIEECRSLRTVHHSPGCRFDDNHTPTRRIDIVFPSDNAITGNRDLFLLTDVQAGPDQRRLRGIFINLLENPRDERSQNPNAAAGDALQHRIGLSPICVHLCASVVDNSFLRSCPPVVPRAQSTDLNQPVMKFR